MINQKSLREKPSENLNMFSFSKLSLFPLLPYSNARLTNVTWLGAWRLNATGKPKPNEAPNCIIFSFTCIYGKYFETLGKVYLRDSVIVITTKGDTLKSPDLWWDQNKKMFYTDKYATYHSPGKQVSGTIGLEATQDLTSIIFKQPIGTIQVSESGFPQ